jgi:microcystin-dependent protein
MIFLLVGVITPTVFAQSFSIQGILRDPLGRTVEDGSYSLTFRIYDVATGGSALWSETQGSVAVQHGVFTVELGTVVPMSQLSFATQYYIGIVVEQGQELEPRIKLTNSPSAHGVFGVKNTFPSVGNVGVGIASPLAGLHIKTLSATDNLLKIESAAPGGGAITVDATGKIGLNVTPEQALDISGNLKMRDGSILFSDGSALSSAYFGGSASSLTNNGNVIITTDADENGSGSVQVLSGGATVVTVANDGNISTTGSISSGGNVSSAGTLAAAGIKLPFAFEPNPEYVGSPGNYISFGHTGFSEDFIGYKGNTFYFKDSQLGIDASEPDVVVGGRVKDKSGYLAPVGTITMFAGSTAPEGWLLCDGSSVSAATYPDLFSIIGTTYGGNSSNFALPNLTGRLPVGRDVADAAFDALNEKGGEKTHTLTTAEIPSHNHAVDPPATDSYTSGQHTHTVTTNSNMQLGGWSEVVQTGRGMVAGDAVNWGHLASTGTAAENGNHSHYVDIAAFNSSATGNGTAHNILPPYIVLNYIIKY